MTGTISRLSWRCQSCPEVDTCDKKRMELCMVKLEPSQQAHSYKFGRGMTVKEITVRPAVHIHVSQDDIEEAAALVLKEVNKVLERCFYDYPRGFIKCGP